MKGLMNIVKNIFQTGHKNIMCSLLLSTKQNSFSHTLSKVWMRTVNVLSCKTKYDCVELLDSTHCACGTIIYSALEKAYTAKPQFYYQQFSLTEVKQLQTYVLKLSNAKIFGASNVVLVRPGKAIYEPFFNDENQKADYTDTVISQYAGQTFVLKHSAHAKKIQSGIMLSGNYSENYYHFLIELLTKFFLISKLDLPPDIPLIADEVVKETPQYRELLSYFNTTNRDIVYIRRKFSYYVKTLYYPSLLNVIPPNFRNIGDITYTDCLFNLDSIQFLRNTLQPKIVATSSKKRIFLSRRNASFRRNYNEREIIPIFEKYDFQIVCPENYDVAEQIHLFSNADFIAGATGGAFTNILFCKYGCKILCITPSRIELSVFSTIARHLELDLQYLPAHRSEHKSEMHKGFEIDPALVEETLIVFLNK